MRTQVTSLTLIIRTNVIRGDAANSDRVAKKVPITDVGGISVQGLEVSCLE